jgi:hypothetical protein
MNQVVHIHNASSSVRQLACNGTPSANAQWRNQHGDERAADGHPEKKPGGCPTSKKCVCYVLEIICKTKQWFLQPVLHHWRSVSTTDGKWQHGEQCWYRWEALRNVNASGGAYVWNHDTYNISAVGRERVTLFSGIRLGDTGRPNRTLLFSQSPLSRHATYIKGALMQRQWYCTPTLLAGGEVSTLLLPQPWKLCVSANILNFGPLPVQLGLCPPLLLLSDRIPHCNKLEMCKYFAVHKCPLVG